MPLEEEMKREIRRLENEIIVLDMQIDKLNHKMAELVALQRKKEHDIRILKFNFYPEEYEKAKQSTLVGHMKA